MLFDDIEFGEKANFKFANPKFINNDNPPLVKFINAFFRPHFTTFEGVQIEGNRNVDVLKRPLILFRQCRLKEVNFNNCDMGLISFFSSAFYEEAFFRACSWLSRPDKLMGIFKFIRKNQITEEELFAFKKLNEKSTEKYELDYLETYKDISDSYVWLKRSADNTKNYQQGSSFYFNEFEMKRQYLKERGRYIKYFFYSLYRVIAGYGEKPLWTSYWLATATTAFALIYMFTGFSAFGIENIKYNFSPDLPNTLPFLGHFIIALFISFLQAIPIGYLRPNADIIDILCKPIALINSIVSILLIIIIGIGLKRIFRRF